MNARFPNAYVSFVMLANKHRLGVKKKKKSKNWLDLTKANGEFVAAYYVYMYILVGEKNRNKKN